MPLESNFFYIRGANGGDAIKIDVAARGTAALTPPVDNSVQNSRWARGTALRLDRDNGLDLD
jgi:hypothetical protein